MSRAVISSTANARLVLRPTLVAAMTHNRGYTPLPGWSIDSPEIGERVFRLVLATMLPGMAPGGGARVAAGGRG